MLCYCISLVDRLIVLSVLQVQLTVGCVMTFGLADGTLGGLAVLHVEWEIFHRVISMLLENVTKGLGLYKSNVLSAVILSTVIFGMDDRRAFGAPEFMILEA